MFGVDYDLFWRLNPKTLAPFIKAFSLRQKYDDTIAWQTGLYIRTAIASYFNKEVKYPTKPFSMTTQSGKSEQEIMKERLLARMELINSRFGKEE